jgi:hypothetical protein
MPEQAAVAKGRAGPPAIPGSWWGARQVNDARARRPAVAGSSSCASATPLTLATSMFPRVAFEYGQIRCVARTSAAAFPRVADRRQLHVELGPEPERPVVAGDQRHPRVDRNVGDLLDGDPEAFLPDVALDVAPTQPMTSLKLRTRLGEVSLFTVIATLGAPLEVTAANLAIETFLPTDAESAARLHRLRTDDERAAAR